MVSMCGDTRDRERANSTPITGCQRVSRQYQGVFDRRFNCDRNAENIAVADSGFDWIRKISEKIINTQIDLKTERVNEHRISADIRFQIFGRMISDRRWHRRSRPVRTRPSRRRYVYLQFRFYITNRLARRGPHVFDECVQVDHTVFSTY
jgi:hypothetical protein